MSGVTTIDPKADPWEHIRGKTVRVSCGDSLDGKSPSYYVEVDVPKRGMVEHMVWLAAYGRKLTADGDIVKAKIHEERP